MSKGKFLANEAMSGRKVFVSFLSVVGGALVAGAVFLVLGQLGAVWVFLIFAAMLACIPALIVNDSKLYWITLFLFLLPFGIFKNFGSGSRRIRMLETIGGPWGADSLFLQLTDLPLLVLLSLWFIRKMTTGERISFPRISFLPLAYLIWASVGGLFAPYPSLSFFELLVEYKYFLLYLFVINNVDHRKMGEIIVAMLLLGLLIQSGVTIAKYQSQRITNIFGEAFGGFGEFYENTEEHLKREWSVVIGEGESSDKVRAVGTLPHPGATAWHLVSVLPIAFALVLVSSEKAAKWLFLMVFLLGASALYVTYSRGGMLAFITSVVVCGVVAYVRRLAPRKLILLTLALSVMLTPVVVLKLLDYLTTRPEYFNIRLLHMQLAIKMIGVNPLLGVGLNNSTVLRPYFTPGGETLVEHMHPIDSRHFLLLVETGIVGYGLYCLFFVLLMIECYRHSRSADFYVRVLSISILSVYSGYAIFMIADFTSVDAVNTLLWFYAGLVVAMRRNEADAQPAEGYPVSATRFTARNRVQT